MAAAMRQLQAQLLQLPVKGFGRDHFQRAHGRHVQRGGQRGAHRHPALEAPVVVLRHVEPAGRGNLGGRVVEQRGRRQSSFGDRLCVQEGLERAARLAQRRHAIDLGSPAERTAAAHPGPHLATGVVKHQHGTVLHLTAGQLAQLPSQAFPGQTLQAGIDAAAQDGRGRITVPEQAACQVRGNALAGRPVALAQRAASKNLDGKTVGCCRRAGCRLHPGQQGTGSGRDPFGGRVGRAHQHRCQGCLARIQRMRGTPEQRARQGVDADQLAAKGHQVQIGFENLVLLPALLQPAGGSGLRELAGQRAWLVATLQARVQ